MLDQDMIPQPDCYGVTIMCKHVTKLIAVISHRYFPRIIALMFLVSHKVSVISDTNDAVTLFTFMQRCLKLLKIIQSDFNFVCSSGAILHAYVLVSLRYERESPSPRSTPWAANQFGAVYLFDTIILFKLPIVAIAVGLCHFAFSGEPAIVLICINQRKRILVVTVILTN